MFRHSKWCILAHRASQWRAGRLALLVALLVAHAPLPATAETAAESAARERIAAASTPASERTMIPIPAKNPVGIAAMGSQMWVTDAGTGDGNGEVLELNRSTGQLIRK